MDNLHYLYSITNKANGKQYWGQTRRKGRPYTIYRRWNNYNTYLNKSIKKYGNHNFEIQLYPIICDNDTIDLYETQAIAINNSLVPNGFNLDSGGHTHKKLHPETKKKISKNNAMKRPEVRAKMSETIKALGENNPMKRPEIAAKSGKKRRGNNHHMKRPEHRDRMKKVMSERAKCSNFGSLWRKNGCKMTDKQMRIAAENGQQSID